MTSTKNRIIPLLPSAARTATNNTEDHRNTRHRGVRIHINTTLDPAAASVVFTVQGKDELTGDYYTLLASAAVAAVGDTFLLVYPSATAVANTVANNVLPSYWRVLCTHADADSLTYQVTAELLV